MSEYSLLQSLAISGNILTLLLCRQVEFEGVLQAAVWIIAINIPTVHILGIVCIIN